MDLKDSLKSAENIIKILREFPEIKTYKKHSVKYTTEQRAESIKEETFRKCQGVAEKMEREIEEEMERYDEGYFRAVASRREFIEGRMRQIQRDRNSHQERMKIIEEIEGFERRNVRRAEKIVFDERESAEIIRKIHSQEFRAEEEFPESLLRRLVVLNYKPVGSREEKALEKIGCFISEGREV